LLSTVKNSSTPSELLHFSRTFPRISFGAIQVEALSGLILPFFTFQNGVCTAFKVPRTLIR
jgi:hypothetical protein